MKNLAWKSVTIVLDVFSNIYHMTLRLGVK